VAQQLGAGGGQRDAAAVALQEAVAELLLELAHRDRQRGLAEAERAGCGGHAAEPGDLAEVAELSEFHAAIVAREIPQAPSPPSICSASPTTNDASSDASHMMALVTSLASPILPIG
jgi:hypothetical protein